MRSGTGLIFAYHSMDKFCLSAVNIDAEAIRQRVFLVETWREGKVADRCLAVQKYV